MCDAGVRRRPMQYQPRTVTVTARMDAQQMGNALYGLHQQRGRNVATSAAHTMLDGPTWMLSVLIVGTAQRFPNGWQCIAAACTLACRQNLRTIFMQRRAEDSALYTPLQRRLARALDDTGWQGLRSAPVAPNLSGALVLWLLVSL